MGLFKKNGVSPLPYEDFEYYTKDTIIYKNEKMRLAEYNREFNKSLKLEDVYGQDFVNNLTPNEKVKFIPYENMVVDMGCKSDFLVHKLCFEFAKAIVNRDFTSFSTKIAKHAYFLIHDREALFGRDAVIEYWDGWRNRLDDTGLFISLIVEHCTCWNQCVIRVEFESRFSSMYIMIRLDEFGEISHIVYCPTQLHKEFSLDTIGFNWPPLKTSVIKEGIEESIPSLDNHMPCLLCGKQSHLHDWYRVSFTDNRYKVTANVSICPDCNRVVEVIPIGKELIEDAPILYEPELSDFESARGANRLKGIYTFYYTQPLKDSAYTSNLDDTSLYKSKSAELFGLEGDEFGPMTVKKCAEEFATMMFSEIPKESFSQLKQCYLNAFNDGVAEAGVNLAIISVNHDGDIPKGMEYLKAAIDNDSANAMINYFSLLWGDAQYYEAADFLLKVSLRINTSVHCLWNLALLYYYGDAISHNPVQEDRTRALNLLQRIIDREHDSSNEEDAWKTINEAKTFLNQAYSLKDILAESAIDFHRRVASIISEATQDCDDKSELFYALKSLTLPEPYKIGVDRAQYKGIGSISSLYIFNDDQDFSEDDIFNFIQVEKSKIGAWQAYLLKTCDAILPVFWHGGYNKKKFIFTDEDIKEIPLLRTRDMSSFERVIYPSVDFIDTNIASVNCCWWNEWHGLVRETMLVKFDGNKVSFLDPSYPTERHETLIPYNCGILF